MGLPYRVFAGVLANFRGFVVYFYFWDYFHFCSEAV